MEVVKVAGVPPACPPILMENPPRLHTWLLPDISTYQVSWDAAKNTFPLVLHI